jgi:hypothetical protein
VRIRFDFGTDSGNHAEAVSFAGWHLDDISILTNRPEDSTPPVAVLLPPNISVQDAGMLVPDPFIEGADDTGIASVYIDYKIYSGGSSVRDQFRMAMDTVRTTYFAGVFPPLSEPLNVGDSITYRVRLTDFAGNSATYPPAEKSPFRIEFRLRDRIDVLAKAIPSGQWKPVDDTWVVNQQPDHQTLSSLVLGPFDLPANVDNLQLLMFYRYELLATHGGNVKISTDKAKTWQVMRPLSGYNGYFTENPAIPNPLNNEDIFTGSRPNLQQAVFDLLEHKGQQIRLRIDFAAPSQLAPQEFWSIQEAALTYSTLNTVDGGFNIPRSFSLHANFPDPFAASTTLGYTLPKATYVRLEVYDVLGRRIARLVDRNQPPGTYTLTFDGSDLAAGLYLLRMQTDSEVKTEQMLIVR